MLKVSDGASNCLTRTQAHALLRICLQCKGKAEKIEKLAQIENHIKWKDKSKIYLKGCGRTLSWRKWCTTAVRVDCMFVRVRALYCIAWHFCVLWRLPVLLFGHGCLLTAIFGSKAQLEFTPIHDHVMTAVGNTKMQQPQFCGLHGDCEYGCVPATLMHHCNGIWKLAKSKKDCNIFVNEIYIENMGVSKFSSREAKWGDRTLRERTYVYGI